ncbi:MAG TPA: fumarylacetoacetate hydrolase family protein [Acidimicrobiales bacterium]|nr:fumarylacetoacetate hydrolase family protein [Acidimicrobiales bacterium]
MRIGTFSDGTTRTVAVERDGTWRPLAGGPGAEATVILAALAAPDAALASLAEAPLPPGFEPVMPFLPARDPFCLGKNYRLHAEEFARFNGDEEAVPPAPVVFTKSTSALCGPTDPLVVAPVLAAGLDYEAELGVVIGRGGEAIPAADALAHVAGYSVVNDTTARDLQRTHTQWYLGKSLASATPWGPVIVTPDELEPFSERRIGAEVNGEARQDARLGQMIFSVAEAIASISRVVALQPGDLICMGTPSGVGVGFDPPRFLVDGDEVRCFIEGIGELRNRVLVREPAAYAAAGTE